MSFWTDLLHSLPQWSGNPLAPLKPSPPVQGSIDAGRQQTQKAVGDAAGSALGLPKVSEIDWRSVSIWTVIILVGLIGLWGLVAPGGGVAIIERVRR